MCPKLPLPDIIGNRTNDNTNLLPFRSLHATNNSCQWDWWFVDLAHKQPLQHNLVELRISSPCEESVQLHEDSEVRVLRHGRFSVLLFVFVVLYVDTHCVVGSLNANLKTMHSPFTMLCEELISKSTRSPASSKSHSKSKDRSTNQTYDVFFRSCTQWVLMVPRIMIIAKMQTKKAKWLILFCISPSLWVKVFYQTVHHFIKKAALGE